MPEQENVVLSKAPGDGQWSLIVDGRDMGMAVKSVRIEAAGGDPRAHVWLELARSNVHFEGPSEVVLNGGDEKVTIDA
jgi:hypothetical protein